MMTLLPADAEGLVVRALEKCGASHVNAKATAAALISAEMDGQAGHGLSRVPSYAAQPANSRAASESRHRRSREWAAR